MIDRIVGVAESARGPSRSGRDVLAAFLSLRWAKLGGFEYAIPVAMALVVVHFWAQMTDTIGGVPFWVLSVVAVAIVLAAREGFARIEPRHAPPRLMVALVAQVVAFWVLYDVLYLGTQRHLYDLDVYLGSAARWMDGGQPYLTHTVTSWPATPAQDYFLYPPPLLPFFGLLSRLPHDLVVVGWVAALVAAGMVAFRCLGIAWCWSVAMLAFPPMFIGIESGNVAPIAFLLFVAGMRVAPMAGAFLPTLTLFKVQSAIPALWLLRERRWRALFAGVGVVAAICVVTLPMTGIAAWTDWWNGLLYRAASGPAVPGWFGMSFAHYLPAAGYAAIAVALVAVALLIPGRRGLAALGVASIWASPALWAHGFLFALPALLLAENSVLVWLLLGAGAVDTQVWYLFYGAGLIVLAAPRPRRGPLHLVRDHDADAGADAGGVPKPAQSAEPVEPNGFDRAPEPSPARPVRPLA